MKIYISLLIGLFFFSQAKQTDSSQPVSMSDSVLGMFVGRTPCQEISKELNLSMPADCFKLKWDLTLYHDPVTHTPTVYKLGSTFRRRKPQEGKWVITKGTKTNPNAIVYQLDPDKPRQSLYFLKVDDNILFFLDKEKNLLVGNADFSYTLNRR